MATKRRIAQGLIARRRGVDLRISKPLVLGTAVRRPLIPLQKNSPAFWNSTLARSAYDCDTPFSSSPYEIEKTAGTSAVLHGKRGVILFALRSDRIATILATVSVRDGLDGALGRRGASPSAWGEPIGVG